MPIMSYYTCKHCSKTYSARKNLKRHVDSKHKSSSTGEFKCNICDYSSSRSDVLNKHLLSVHRPNFTNTFADNISCPLCGFSCSSHNVLLGHFRAEHGIVIADKESFKFENEDKFYEWKLSVESSEKCRYVRRRGIRTAPEGKVKCTFVCFRDGVFKSRSSMVRKEKALGTNKINGHCPARMVVTKFPSGEMDVEYHKTHVGHENEVCRMRLSQTERDEVAKSIAMNVPFDEILHSCRTRSSASSAESVERRELITRKDIHNIARDYNLKQKGTRSGDDCTSVHSWVQEMEEVGNVVLFYKAQGTLSEEYPQLKEEDFVLIMMNETQSEMFRNFSHKFVCVDTHRHGTELSQGFELTTLLVLDDVCQVFPCTFMFSNRTDFEVLKVLFLNVRSVLGHELKANVFMADMSEECLNAWLSVMEEPIFRMFCSWEVDRDWRSNLSKVKGGKKKQSEVYKVVRSLMEERDRKTFEQHFDEVLKNLKNDTEADAFGDYFEALYQPTAESWAHCFRLHTGARADKHLERMHGAVKHIYAKGSKPKRIHVVILALMRFLRDKLLDRVLSHRQGRHASKLPAIRQRHAAALALDAAVELREEGGGAVAYRVAAKERGAEAHHVTPEDAACGCGARCAECGVCVHAYICTCADSAIKFNMCKHIHLVVQALNSTAAVLDQAEGEFFIGEEQLDCDVEETVVNEVERFEVHEATYDLEAGKEVVKNEFMGLLNEVTSEKDLELMSQLVAQTLVTMRANRCWEENSVLTSDGTEEPPVKIIKLDDVKR